MRSSRLPMRRFENGTRDPRMIAAMLDMISTVHVGCIDEEGYPYVVPMNFGYEIRDGKLLVFVHCAREGHKVDLWRKNPKVSLTFDVFFNHPDRDYRGSIHDYRSVMALGTIEEVVRQRSAGLHGTAVQAILRHNGRAPTQFSVPHYLWMAVYVITCDWEDVSGKMENPVGTPEELPFPDLTQAPCRQDPFDPAWFYVRKPREGGAAAGFGELPEAEEFPEGAELPVPACTLRIRAMWKLRTDTAPVDADLSALVLGPEGTVRRRYDMAFYNQRRDRTGTVLHEGDDLETGTPGTESLLVHLGDAPREVREIRICLGIYRADARGGGLAALSRVCLEAETARDAAPVARMSLDPGNAGGAACLAVLRRREDGWVLCRELRPCGGWSVLDLAGQAGLHHWSE